MPALKIDERISVGDIQKEFNSIFPFLKIEFFKTAINKADGNSYKTTSLLTSTDKIGKSTKTIDVTSSTTVAQLKTILKNTLGITSLIYRRSGSMWIETSLTEDWTLERQNHEAEQMSSNSI